MSREDEMFKIINFRSDCQRIAEYIVTHFPVNFGMEDAIAIAKYFMETFNYTKDEVIRGEKDNDIYEKIKYFLIKPKTVKQKIDRYQEIESKDSEISQREVDIPLKTAKKNVDPELVAKFIAMCLSASLVLGFAIKGCSDLKKDRIITEGLANDKSLVADNYYATGRKSDGSSYIAYHHDQIAQDIIEKCAENIDYFDVCLHNVYFNMENKLTNMDEVFRYLKAYTKDEESMQPIYLKICNCEVFLDYLISSGLVDIKDDEYQQLLEDIKSYKDTKSFSSLPKDTQKRIEDLISKYRRLEQKFQKQYFAIVNGEAKMFGLEDEEPGFGGRV